MLFLELAAQGVRGFSPSIRVALKPGYSALKSPTDLPAPLAGLVVALAFPDGRGGDAGFLAPGAKAGRAGLSIQGADGSVWRIVRDLGGAGGLHKLNRATNTFEVVSQEAGEMAQALRSGAGFPARTTWEQLFTLTGPQLPTRRPKGPARAAAAAAPRAAPRMQSGVWLDPGAGGGGGEPVDPEKLKALEAELVTAKRAAELQFKLDGFTNEVFTLESKLKARDELKAKVDAARAEAKKVAALSSALPDDIVARATRYPEERKRYEEQLARLREERFNIESQTPAKPPALYKDQRFLLSVGAGLLCFVAAIALRDSAVRYLSLLSLLPFTFGALLALRYIEDLQLSGREDGKSTVISGREKKLTDEFQMSTMVVQRAFESVNALTLEEFVGEMKRREELKGHVAQLELEWTEWGADPDNLGLEDKVRALKAEHEAANQELLSMSGGYVREVREIERELARIKEPAAPPRSTPSGEFAAVNTGPGETFEDPAPALMVLATDLFSTDVPSLWSVLHDRAVQYLTALTDRRYHGISLDKDGHVTLEAPGRTVPARELPGKDLDLMFLALRLTLIEKAAAQHKLPVVIEDTFNTVLDGNKPQLFARMVKHLGTLTQVLHVSGGGQNATLADTPTPI